MLQLAIPGRPALEIAHLVLDYNGTLAHDGAVIAAVPALLQLLSTHVTVHVVTADTFGTARAALAGLPCTVALLTAGRQAEQKLQFVQSLGANQTIAVGNGANDRLMLTAAAIGIAVLQGEGAAAATLIAADIVCPSIAVALELLLHPQRLTATLRT